MSAPRAAGFGRWSLATRIVALFLGLLLVVQAAGFVALHQRTRAQAQRALEAQLATGERALAELRAQNATRLRDAAVMLGRDYGFITTLAGTGAPCGSALCGDAQTVTDALDSVGARVDASLSALFDTGLRAHGGAQAEAVAPLLPRLVAPAGDGLGLVAVIGGRATQLVAAPLKTPLTIGWVVMGFGLDNALGQRLARITGQQVVVLTRAGADAPWQAPVSTLDAAQTAALVATLGRQAPQREVELAGESFLTRALPLSVPGAPGGEAQALLLLSVDQALASYRALQKDLALITALGIVVFGLGSWASSRRVTQPIRSLAAAADQLAGGDYGTPMRGLHRGDEIGDLAQRFELMRISVASKNAEIRAQALRDARTGLPNRACFTEALDAQLREARHASAAVLWLDLDRFKRVNDALGHAQGDRVLAAVAERLAGLVGPADLVARVGGDEFALLLPGVGAAAGLAFARRVATTFEDALTLEDQPVDVTVGIGVACWPEHASDASTLMSRAELAMNAAKRAAAGPQAYSPSREADARQSLGLLSELRRALDHGELRLYLQPKVALDDGRLVGAEALVRWQHPQRGLVPPAQFIPYAESTGFIRRLTLWACDEAASHWVRMAAHGGEPPRISVNLSARDLFDAELPNKIEALLARRGAPVRALCLEITESAIMDDPQRAKATLRELAARGFRLSIDDFGTGHSSLAYLAELPVHELKVDQAFVRHMADDAKSATIVRMAIDLAHNLQLSAVAEGVEDADAWNRLHALGCDEAQGWHMGKAMPVEQFLAWRERWRTREATGWMGLELH